MNSAVHLWTCRIALVAYLIGGWIVPSAHHHAHHGGHGQSGCHSPEDSHSGVNSDDTSVVCRSHHQSCCCSHHQAPMATTSENAADQQTSPQLPGLYSGTSLNCDGLCAICVSRMLVTDSIELAVVSTGRNTQLNEVAKATSVVQPLRFGIACPRGPPCEV